MDVSRNLFGKCASVDDKTGVATVDMAGLVRRLLLFDTYTLESIRLKELPHLIRLFGYDGLMTLLTSKVLRIYSDAVTIASIGQGPVIERCRRRGNLPLGQYDFSNVRIADWEWYITDNLRVLDSTEGLDSYKCYRLKKVVRSLLAMPTADVSQLGVEQLRVDLTNNDPAIKTSLAWTLSKKLGTSVTPADFNIRVHRVDDYVFRAESDIIERFGLAEGDMHKTVERALLAVGGFEQRMAEMQAFSAISGFPSDELPILTEKMRFLAESVLPGLQEERLQRVLKIRGFPEPDLTDRHARVDAERLLEIRDSAEFREFRDWLSSVANVSDSEIRDRIASLQARISGLIHSRPGSDIRFLIMTGIGLIPGLGIPLGIVDRYLLEEVIPYSGPATFINQMYPSIFERRDADECGGSLEYGSL